jgi:hypothetical protein
MSLNDIHDIIFSIISVGRVVMLSRMVEVEGASAKMQAPRYHNHRVFV